MKIFILAVAVFVVAYAAEVKNTDENKKRGPLGLDFGLGNENIGYGRNGYEAVYGNRPVISKPVVASGYLSLGNDIRAAPLFGKNYAVQISAPSITRSYASFIPAKTYTGQVTQSVTSPRSYPAVSALYSTPALYSVSDIDYSSPTVYSAPYAVGQGLNYGRLGYSSGLNIDRGYRQGLEFTNGVGYTPQLASGQGNLGYSGY